MATELVTAFNTVAELPIIALSIGVAPLVEDACWRRFFRNTLSRLWITDLIDRTFNQIVRALIAEARILRAKIAVSTIGIHLAARADPKRHAGSPPYAGLAGATIRVRLADRTSRDEWHDCEQEIQPQRLNSIH